MNIFIIWAKVTQGVTNPLSFDNVVFGGNGIEPEPYFDLQGGFSFPRMFK